MILKILDSSDKLQHRCIASLDLGRGFQQLYIAHENNSMDILPT